MHPRVLVVEHQDDCPPALLGDWLVEAGCVLDVRRPYADDPLPEDLGDHQALMVLGGSMGAHDDDRHPWLGPTKRLVLVADRAAVPVLGVCLGHQLAAVALGGRSAPNPRGQAVGLTPVEWTPEAASDPLTGPVVGPRRGVFWNDDVVVVEPAGTVALARAGTGELQAARFAEHVWGVQLHPEVTEPILRRWAEEDGGGTVTAVAEERLAAVAAAADELTRAWRPLAQSLADLASVAAARRG